MKNWLERYRPYIKNKRFLISTGISFLLLGAGVIATYFGIIYANEKASNSVTDIILSNIRVFDVDGIFTYGPVLFWIIIGLYIFFFEPKKIPFTLKSAAIFLLIRAIFISLTHIGPFPTHIQIASTSIFSVFTTGNDLFFSSHTGFPFLMALIFWDNKYLRIFSLIASLVFGTVVLLAHLHYSIDVFAAFFITYSIFHLNEKLFKKDREIFINGLSY